MISVIIYMVTPSESMSSKFQKAREDLQTALDKTYGQGKYHVADTTLGEFDGLRKAEEGNPVGVCAEPKAAIAASKIDSPITGMSTQWRGKASNPYPYSGDKTELLDISSDSERILVRHVCWKKMNPFI